MLNPITALAASGPCATSALTNPATLTQEGGCTGSANLGPRSFTPDQYATLCALCRGIIPPDNRSGDAIEAGAPEFIDLMATERPEYKIKLPGGLMWLDATCRIRYGTVYRECRADQQHEILDLIAYRENGAKDPGIAQGIPFFSLLRKLTVDAFFTSEIGIRDLGYIGNTYLDEFPGCPPLPEENEPEEDPAREG